MDRINETCRVAPLMEALEFEQASGALFDEALALYSNHVEAHMVQLLAGLRQDHAAMAKSIEAQLAQLGYSEESPLPAYFLYPEMTHRLLYAPEAIEANGEFLLRTLSAELARSQGHFNHNAAPYLWSSLGDFVIQHDSASGEYMAFDAPRLFDTLPVDFMSPYCQRVTAQEMNEPEGSLLGSYSMQNIGPVLEFIEESTLPLAQLPQGIMALVTRFTSVLGLRTQHQEGHEPVTFSGTDGKFIGRTILGNPEHMSPEMLAESLVHEAIHALLYMVDVIYPWMPTTDESGQRGFVVPSNWTGNKISLRSYPQALFVWYGLYRFYAHALASGQYHKGRVTERMAFIRNGFETVDLAAMEKAYGLTFDPELVAVAQTMRSRMLQTDPLNTLA